MNMKYIDQKFTDIILIIEKYIVDIKQQLNPQICILKAADSLRDKINEVMVYLRRDIEAIKVYLEDELDDENGTLSLDIEDTKEIIEDVKEIIDRIHIIEGLFDVWDTSIVTSLNCSATIQTYVGLLKKETDEWKNEKN